MKILSGHEGHIADYQEKNDLTEVTLCSKEGNTKLDIYCYADVKWKGLIKKRPFLMAPELPILIEAHDPKSGERFVVFDQSIHGYDAVFCDYYMNGNYENRRPLKKLVSAEKIIVRSHYSIDYEEEKSDFEFDENGMVKTERGDTLDWEYAKANGADWIILKYVDDNGKTIEFIDLELA